MASEARQILPASADGTERWKEVRQEGFGGTNANHLWNGTKSRFAMWREKRGLVEPEPITPELQAIFDFGHSREPEIARIFSERTGLRVRNTGTWARRDHEWMLANPDRFVGTDGILEIKTTGPYTPAARTWVSGGVTDSAWAQANWYAYVTGRRVLYFAAEVDRQVYIAGPFERDEALITTLVQDAIDFWASVEDGTPPPFESTADVLTMHPRSEQGLTVTVEPWSEVALAVEELVQVKADIKALEAREKALKAQVQSSMGDAEVLATPDGETLATWRSQTRAGGLDVAALAADAGLDPEKYRKPSTHPRTFLPKEI